MCTICSRSTVAFGLCGRHVRRAARRVAVGLVGVGALVAAGIML